jgi:DUF1680 family protein
MKSFMRSSLGRGWLPAALGLGMAAAPAPAANTVPLPDQVKPVIADRQDVQVPDRARLSGWVGGRIDVNEANRLVKLDTDRLLESFRHRPGRQSYDGEHVGKWLHAATLAWVNTGDPVLRQRLDHVVAELVKCQLPDGYLGTYLDADRWTEWDVWSHKYNLIGLLTYIRYTGNQDPLAACRKMGDLLCRTFGDQPGQRDIIAAGWHAGMAPSSVLEAMVLLYRMTGERRYLDFCQYILRAWEQPNGPKIVSTLLREKRVDRVGNGKAYEMLDCLNGALEYYRTTGDARLLEACRNAWQDIVAHRLYPTGTASYREFFHGDGDLPSVSDVGETCVTVTWLQFNGQLLRLTDEKRYADEMAKTVLNQLLGAQSCDGAAWGYYVQMQGRKPYSSNLDGHCCLSSGPRGIALLPTFALTTDADGAVVNLYDAAKANLTLRDGAAVSLAVRTEYPAEEKILIAVDTTAKEPFAVKLRIPSWCPKASVLVNGAEARGAVGSDGYLALRRQWQEKDLVELHLPMKARFLLGDHRTEGKLAVCYGPLVLAADTAVSDGPVGEFSIPGTAEDKLAITPEAAPANVKTWPGARVFRMAYDGTDLPFRMVPFADAGTTGSRYKVWLPFGPPRPGEDVLLDGVESRSRELGRGGSINDGDPHSVSDTFNGESAAQDWFAVSLDRPVAISRVVFAHGKNFHDGGWFDASAGKPAVQIKSTADGSWEDLCPIEDYPATSATDPAKLEPGQRFTCVLEKPVKMAAIRVIGKPACGDNPKQSFSSCAQLEAYAAAP